MTQFTPRPADTRFESVRALAEQYAARHRAIENYTLGWFTTFALTVLVPLFIIQRGMSGTAVPVGTIVVSALLLYQLGENTYATFMLGIESRILAAYDYALYRLGAQFQQPTNQRTPTAICQTPPKWCIMYRLDTRAATKRRGARF
jgi:hypothetical protein